MDEGAACRGTQRRSSHAECNVTSHVVAAVTLQPPWLSRVQPLSLVERFPPRQSARGRRSFSISHFVFSYLRSSETARDTHIWSLFKVCPSPFPLLSPNDEFFGKFRAFDRSNFLFFREMKFVSEFILGNTYRPVFFGYLYIGFRNLYLAP